MGKRYWAFKAWMRMRYDDKPIKVKVGDSPYREAEHDVSNPVHFAVLVWRMAMEGADKTANSMFKHWKAIFILGLIIVATLGWCRWSKPVIATIDIWSLEQQKKQIQLAKEVSSAQAEKAKSDEANAATAASAQSEKSKLDEARAKAAASTSASTSASAQAEKAKLDAARTQDGEKNKPRAFYVSERYWACVHKVVKCSFNGQGNQYDSNNVVKCDPSYTTTGGGFGTPHCPEGDAIQTTMVLKMQNGPEKIIVPNDVYDKHEKDVWVFLMCNQQICDLEIVDPPPPETPAPAISSPSAPQPSAALVPTTDSRAAQR